MKKLMPLLASFGLVVAGGSTIVACGVGNNDKGDNINVTVGQIGEDFVITNVTPVEADLVEPANQKILATEPIPNSYFGHLVFADKNGKKFILNKDSKVDVKAQAFSDINQGESKAKVMFSMTVNKEALKSVGLVKQNGEISGNTISVRLGKANWDGNLESEICRFNLESRSFVLTINDPTISGEATIVSPTELDIKATFIPTFIPDRAEETATSVTIKNVNDLSDNVSWSVWPTVWKPNADTIRIDFEDGKRIPEATSEEQRFIITVEWFKGSAELIIPAAK